MFIGKGQRLRQSTQPLVETTCLTARFGQQAKAMGHVYFRPPCRASIGQTFLYLGNPLLGAPLLCHSPATNDSRKRQPVGESVLGTERNQALRILLNGASFAEKLREKGNKNQGKSQTVRLGQPLS